MKQSGLKSKIFVVLLVSVLLCAVCLCMTILASNFNAIANAVEKPTSVEFSIEDSSVNPGQTFILKVKISTTRTQGWSSAMVRIMPITKDSALDKSMVADKDASAVLSYDTAIGAKFAGNDATSFTEGYDLVIGDNLKSETDPFINLSISTRSYDILIDSQKPIFVEIPIKVAEGATINSVRFSFKPVKTTKIVYGILPNITTDIATNAVSGSEVSVNVNSGNGGDNKPVTPPPTGDDTGVDTQPSNSNLYLVLFIVFLVLAVLEFVAIIVLAILLTTRKRKDNDGGNTPQNPTNDGTPPYYTNVQNPQQPLQYAQPQYAPVQPNQQSQSQEHSPVIQIKINGNNDNN